MMSGTLDDADYITRIENYRVDVRKIFEAEPATERFPHYKTLMTRFEAAVNARLTSGGPSSAINEIHNELCLASFLLASEEPQVTLLEYEPSLVGTGKSIDFRATTDQRQTVYVDAKTIQPQFPESRDLEGKRKHLAEFVTGNRIPKNVNVFVDGMHWHLMYSARTRMLEHTLGLEAKIREANLVSADSFFIMAFCSSGFHWTEDEL